MEAYADNTDEPTRTCFHIHIKLALHLINLLPINVQCSIDVSISSNQCSIESSTIFIE
jgi:hypothetical protein